MRKVYELESTFATGEATIQPVLLWGADGRPLRESFTKTASEASEYIKAVEPKPGKSIILVLALGAYETYDLNRNGDGFNEFPYRQGLRPSCGCCDHNSGGWIAQEDVLPNHYKSFEQFGKIYRHHQNKDPTKACGEVVKAFWNPAMHRVELLLGLDNALAPDLAERIADGEYPAVSMGCRIKYDVCTECGHRAPTRAKYCDHLKLAMRQVGKKGLRHGALNPSPKFFDISFVVKPADQTGYMMKKVAFEGAYEVRSAAELGEFLDVVEEKRAAIRKIADIDKVVRGIPVDHKVSPLPEGEARVIEQYRDSVMPAVNAAMPDIDNGTIKNLADHPLKDVLSTLSAAGIILTTPEFVKLTIEKMSPGTQVPEEALDAIVGMQGHILDLFAEHPQMLDQVLSTHLLDMRADNVKPDIAVKAEQYLEKRSTISDYLSRSLVPAALRDEEPPWTDTLHVRDPGTGAQYATNRGAAINAHDNIAKKQLMKMLGGAALLAGAYKLTAGHIQPKILRPVLAATLGMVGYKHLRPDFGPHYMTEEGIPISTLTELAPEDGPAKMSSDISRTALPLLGTGALVTALGHDYDSRLRRGAVGDPNAAVWERIYEQLAGYASEHPALSFLGGLASYGTARNLAGKFSEYVGDVEKMSTADAVSLPEVDVDSVAEKLGQLLLM